MTRQSVIENNLKIQLRVYTKVLLNYDESGRLEIVNDPSGTTIDRESVTMDPKARPTAADGVTVMDPNVAAYTVHYNGRKMVWITSLGISGVNRALIEAKSRDPVTLAKRIVLWDIKEIKKEADEIRHLVYLMDQRALMLPLNCLDSDIMRYTLRNRNDYFGFDISRYKPMARSDLSPLLGDLPRKFELCVIIEPNPKNGCDLSVAKLV